MLTPEYLLQISEGAEAIAEELHSDIVNRIVKSIMLRLDRGDDYVLTAKDKWMLEVLQDSGVLLEDIQKEIAKKTGLQQTEIKEAMEDACVTNMRYEDELYHAAGIIPGDFTQSPYMMRLMQQTYEATLGEWTNFTRTTAEAAQRAYISACDKAYTQVASGAISYTQAVKEAVESMVSEGVTVKYPTGHTDTIETATLRAVRTGVSQASARITMARMDEYGEDLVLVSSHLGARPTHFLWQGKVYSRSGTHPKYPDFRKSTRYGEVDGLCGANCRHNFSVYFEGMPNPFEKFDAEENQKRYETEQRQRTMERRIRKTKREVMGLKTARDNAKTPETAALEDLAYQRKAALLQKQNAAYKEYCEKNNLKQLQDRLAIAKWDRKQAAAARGAARRRIEAVGESAAVYNWDSISVVGGQSNTKYRRITGRGSIESDLAATNPGFKSGQSKYTQNCQRCVVAYEMRRRGYDVIAKPAIVEKSGKLSKEDPMVTAWSRVFNGIKYTPCYGEESGKQSIIAQMNKWDQDGRAMVRVLWNKNEGHVFVAERIQGNIRFLDPQNGRIDCDKYFAKALKGGTIMARMDNLQPREDLLKECIKNRGGRK